MQGLAALTLVPSPISAGTASSSLVQSPANGNLGAFLPSFTPSIFFFFF